MIDLYLLICPLLVLCTLLALLALKLALRDSSTVSRLYSKHEQICKMKDNTVTQQPTKQTVKHLMLTFTPIQLCAVRRGKYKLSLMLAISIVMVGSWLVPSPFAFVVVGTIVYFAYFFLNMALTHEQQQQTPLQHRQKYIQVVFTAITVILNIFLLSQIFKNYHNSLLTPFIANVAINAALDSFLVRPLLTLLIATAISYNQNVVAYVANCQKELNLLDTHQALGEKQMLLKPNRMYSPSKIPKCIPVDMEIEPRVGSLMRRQSDQAFQRPVDLLRRIKRQKLLPPLNLNLQRNLEDCSLNSLNNTNKKEELHDEDHLQGPLSDKNKENQQPTQYYPFKKKVVSDNMILINPSHHEPVDNEEDIETEGIANKNIGEDSDALPSRKGTTSNGEGNTDPLKISLNSSTSRHQPLRICLNGQVAGLQMDNCSQDSQESDQRRRRQLMTLQDGTKNPYGVLQIKEQNNPSGQIQEIDIYSPDKRRRLHVQFEQQSKVMKKKRKKMSHDLNNRVIKFSTGEPYLQYLPNMLNKDHKNKKSQALSRKEVPDSRIVSSVKRPNKKRPMLENNQNIMPEFRIEEL